MAKYNNNGTIDVNIIHPVYGTIPYTASINATDDLGVQVWDDLMSGIYGEIEPYIEPTPNEILHSKREIAVLTRREFFLAIDAVGMYDAVMAMKYDPLTPRATVIELDTATEFKRLWPTLIDAATQLGVTDEQLDQLFGIVP